MQDDKSTKLNMGLKVGGGITTLISGTVVYTLFQFEWGRAVLGSLLSLAIFGGLIAWGASKLAKKVLQRAPLPQRLISFIAWSCVITWTLPILGIITSVATFQFSKSDKLISSRKKYRTLFYAGILLSLLNSITASLR